MVILLDGCKHHAADNACQRKHRTYNESKTVITVSIEQVSGRKRAERGPDFEA
jgi:hypothetical protein